MGDVMVVWGLSNSFYPYFALFILHVWLGFLCICSAAQGF